MPMSVADLLDDVVRERRAERRPRRAGRQAPRQGPRSGGTAFNLLHHHVGSPPGVFRRRARTSARARRTAGHRDPPRRRRAPHPRARRPRRPAWCSTAAGRSRPRLVVSGARSAAHAARARRSRLARSRSSSARCATSARAASSRARRSRSTARPGFCDARRRALARLPRARVRRREVRARLARAVDRSDERRPQRVDVHVQYVPYALAEGEWDDARRDALGRSRRAASGPHPVAQRSIERRMRYAGRSGADYGWPQGQAYHAELALDQVLWMRPVPELARYRTPIAASTSAARRCIRAAASPARREQCRSLILRERERGQRGAMTGPPLQRLKRLTALVPPP